MTQLKCTFVKYSDDEESVMIVHADNLREALLHLIDNMYLKMDSETIRAMEMDQERELSAKDILNILLEWQEEGGQDKIIKLENVTENIVYVDNNFEDTGMSEKEIQDLSNEDLEKMGLYDEDEFEDDMDPDEAYEILDQLDLDDDAYEYYHECLDELTYDDKMAWKYGHGAKSYREVIEMAQEQSSRG